MKNTAQVQQKSKVGAGGNVGVGTEVSKVSVTVVAVFGVIVGLWSLASLVGGLVASGGPLALVGNWFKAVSGM
jgi:hypothetical protein